MARTKLGQPRGQGQARAEGAPRFYRRSALPPGVGLALRIGATLGLIGIALAGHWLDRDGLRDNADGQISFLDVVYFTMITVTTVGYGDIVPVTDRARLFDTFIVTPVRIFIWLIFFGSAYSFLLRNGWEQWRMKAIQRRLSGHTIIGGFGATGREAAAELVRRGCRPERIVVVDEAPGVIEDAIEQGFATVQGDATHNAVLEAAGLAQARALLVTPGRDDTAVLIALTARRLAPSVPVAVAIRETENEILARDAGALVIVNSVSFGGQLLAGSSLAPRMADYVCDLITHDGEVMLRERPVRRDEIGLRLTELGSGQGMRLYRAERAIGFWEADAVLQAGDTVLEVVPRGEASSG